MTKNARIRRGEAIRRVGPAAERNIEESARGQPLAVAGGEDFASVGGAVRFGGG